MDKKRFNLNEVETFGQTSLQGLYDAIKNEACPLSITKKKKIGHLYEIMDEIDDLTHEINEIDRDLIKKYYFN